MRNAAQGTNWRELAEEVTGEFRAWGCRYRRNRLPEIALGYDCDALFFWNWMDGEVEKSETGFLRVLGYVWRKVLAENAEAAPAAVAAGERAA